LLFENLPWPFVIVVVVLVALTVAITVPITILLPLVVAKKNYLKIPTKSFKGQ